jgi:hypothetical protein
MEGGQVTTWRKGGRKPRTGNGETQTSDHQAAGEIPGNAVEEKQELMTHG